MTEQMWTCKPCKVSIPMARMDRVRAHLATKKHERLKDACPRCSSLRIKPIVDECWDRDGIREAVKCERCKTEYKSFAHGWVEKDASEYTGEQPQHIIRQEAKRFDQIARSRGYVKVKK